MPLKNSTLRAEITDLLARAGLLPGHTVRTAAALTATPGQRAEAAADGNLRWTLTTEQPALVWDWERFDFVSEVLLMDGLVLPAIRQVPLLDAHSRSSVDDHLGSVSDIRTSTASGFAAVEGLVRFAADDKSQRTRQKVLDGHLTDGSVGYRVDRALWIPEGMEAAVRGRLFTGPVKVSHEWSLKEFSITPIGADTLAKVRGRLANAR
jgi:hypothetical protein